MRSHLLSLFLAMAVCGFAQNPDYDPSNIEYMDQTLYLSLNLGGGAKLQLSDGTFYEIAPEDQIYSSLWITPFPVELSRSSDPNYPVMIINANTGTTVKARQMSPDEVRQLQQQIPQRQITPGGQPAPLPNQPTAPGGQPTQPKQPVTPPSQPPKQPKPGQQQPMKPGGQQMQPKPMPPSGGQPMKPGQPQTPPKPAPPSTQPKQPNSPYKQTRQGYPDTPQPQPQPPLPPGGQQMPQKKTPPPQPEETDTDEDQNLAPTPFDDWDEE